MTPEGSSVFTIRGGIPIDQGMKLNPELGVKIGPPEGEPFPAADARNQTRIIPGRFIVVRAQPGVVILDPSVYVFAPPDPGIVQVGTDTGIPAFSSQLSEYNRNTVAFHIIICIFFL